MARPGLRAGGVGISAGTDSLLRPTGPGGVRALAARETAAICHSTGPSARRGRIASGEIPASCAPTHAVPEFRLRQRLDVAAFQLGIPSHRFVQDKRPDLPRLAAAADCLAVYQRVEGSLCRKGAERRLRSPQGAHNAVSLSSDLAKAIAWCGGSIRPPDRGWPSHR